MLGLVDYASDSDGDQELCQQQQGQQQPQTAAAAAAAAAAAPPARPASGLPSAAELLDSIGSGMAPTGRLPPPNFGSVLAPGHGVSGPRAAATAGAKRAHPDTRGPLPNPMSLDSKLPRSVGASNVAVAKPAAPGGIMLPPQLRGRANVPTEDLSVFTKQSQLAARQQQRSASGGGSAGG